MIFPIQSNAESATCICSNIGIKYGIIHKTEVAAKEMAYENMYRQTKIAYRYLHSDSKTTNPKKEEISYGLYHSGPPADRELFKELFSCQSTSEWKWLMKICTDRLKLRIVTCIRIAKPQIPRLIGTKMLGRTPQKRRNQLRSLPFRTASRSRAFQGIIFVPINT
jgi:hypothetical protein